MKMNDWVLAFCREAWTFMSILVEMGLTSGNIQSCLFVSQRYLV